jgi:hypothetical protein
VLIITNTYEFEIPISNLNKWKTAWSQLGKEERYFEITSAYFTKQRQLW